MLLSHPVALPAFEATPAMPRLTAPRALAPLRQRGFRLLTIGHVTSNLGDGATSAQRPGSHAGTGQPPGRTTA